MWRQRLPYTPTAYTDDWEDQPAQGWFYKWGLGIILAALLAGWGLHGIATRQMEFGKPDQSLTLSGANAVAFGIAWCSAALFVHCHYFWGNIYNQAWFAVLGKIFGAIGFIVGLVFVLIRNGLMGIG